MAINKQILGLEDLAMEQAVLGALMMQGKTIFSKVEILLKAEHFSDYKNRVIFQAIKDLHEKGEGYDLLLLRSSLKKANLLEDAGGVVNLTNIADKVASAANIEIHARIIVECYMRRQIIDKNETALKQWEVTQFDPLKTCDEMIDFYINLRAQAVGASKSVEANSNEAIENYMQYLSSADSIIDTGMDVCEKYSPTIGEFSVIGARPAMGKSAYMTSQISNILKQNEASKEKTLIGCFSLEMSENIIYSRIHSNMLYMNGEKFRTRNLSAQEKATILTNQAKFKGLYVYNDKTLSAIRSKTLELKQVAKRQGYTNVMIYIDFLQLMKIDSKKNAAEGFGEIANGLKLLANELQIHICALAQISRVAETRGGDKKPQISDLKASGAIEEAADFVAMLHRPEYYGFETDAEGASTKGKATIIVGKNRNGETGEIEMKFEGQFSAFRNIQQSQAIPIESQKDYFANVTGAQAAQLYETNDLPF